MNVPTIEPMPPTNTDAIGYSSAPVPSLRVGKKVPMYIADIMPVKAAMTARITKVAIRTRATRTPISWALVGLSPTRKMWAPKRVRFSTTHSTTATAIIHSSWFGTPATFPVRRLRSRSKSGSRSTVGRPWISTISIPRNRNSVPRVMTSDGMPRIATSTPLNRPHAAPTSRHASTASRTLPVSAYALTTPTMLSAITDPNERSISRVMTTSVSASATIANSGVVVANAA